MGLWVNSEVPFGLTSVVSNYSLIHHPDHSDYIQIIKSNVDELVCTLYWFSICAETEHQLHALSAPEAKISHFSGTSNDSFHQRWRSNIWLLLSSFVLWLLWDFETAEANTNLMKEMCNGVSRRRGCNVKCALVSRVLTLPCTYSMSHVCRN